MSETDTLDRLLRACATGYGCRSAVSPKGLGRLTRQNLWHQAAEAIVRLDAIHPRSRDCFLDSWLQTCPGFHQAVAGSFAHLDDDLAIAFLRKVLPAYRGYDTILFRGQAMGPVGKSWTAIPNVALSYALYGDREMFPLEDEEGRADAVILRAIVPASNIICAPALLMKPNAEYIIDPRGFEFSIEPALDAAVWIREHLADVSRRASAEAERWMAKRLAAETATASH